MRIGDGRHADDDYFTDLCKEGDGGPTGILGGGTGSAIHNDTEGRGYAGAYPGIGGLRQSHQNARTALGWINFQIADVRRLQHASIGRCEWANNYA